jgi:hypothetical protein
MKSAASHIGGDGGGAGLFRECSASDKQSFRATKRAGKSFETAAPAEPLLAAT